jgi:hypothetical protein
MYNTAENAIFTAYRRAGNELGRLGPRNGTQTVSIDKYEGVAGDIKKSTTSTVTIKWAGPGVFSDGATNLTYNDAVSFTDQIDKMYIGSEHTNVKQNKVWKKMYLCEDRMLSFMDSGGHPTRKLVTSMPCHNCGVLLPIQSIEVDHQNPQVGGRFVLKIFRILGLTTAAATGVKGGLYVLHKGSRSGLKTEQIYPNDRAMGDAAYLTTATTTPTAKWTTTAVGSLLLSAFAFADAMDDLDRFCRNSVLNLVPRCRACNGAKGNLQRAVA